MSDLTQISGIPLYIQIRERILEQIKSNEISMGDRLPTEEDMARDLGVSRMTVRRAIEDLVNEGFLTRKRGVGTFVIAKKMTRHYTRLTSFFEEAMEQGLKPSSKVISLIVTEADPELAEALNIEPGSQVYQVTRLRLLDQEPFAVHVAHIPFHLLDLYDEKDLEGKSLYRIYQDNHLPIGWAKQKIEARLADEELAEYLDIEIGSPILYSERVSYSDADVPIEWVQAYSIGNVYAIEVIMMRDKA